MTRTQSAGTRKRFVLPPPSDLYPESDGKPMSDNDIQRRWIVRVIENVRYVFRARNDVYVTGDLLWYPCREDPKISQAPDCMVVFGRPRHERRSWLQWEEGGIGPSVVFEIWSYSNTALEWRKKMGFYERYGVREVYLIDPVDNRLRVWIQHQGALREQDHRGVWESPLLGVRFLVGTKEIILLRPDGKAFMDWEEIEAQREEEARRAEREKLNALLQVERAEKYAARLRAMGLDPDAE
jgi:Uma2 family endonuclease